MHKTIISDTSCFIILSKINELDLLKKVYGQIFTTPDIVEEFDEMLPEWVIVENVSDKSKQRILELQIDRGESSAIALALEMPKSTLILDDFKARKIAQQLGIPFTGTIGVIIKAKLNGIIPSIKPYLEKIKETNFRISAEIELQALKEAQEFLNSLDLRVNPKKKIHFPLPLHFAKNNYFCNLKFLSCQTRNTK